MKSIVENKITLNNREFAYIVNYKNIKNIYFRVKEDLKIHVTCNKFVNTKYIEKLLTDNEQSIFKMYQKQIEKQAYNKDIFYLGNKLILIKYEGTPYISHDYIYANNIESAKKYIYSLAFDIFNERMNKIKINYNDLPAFKLKIRKMTSKWGVCNKRSMTVTLNTELITKDVHLIDYVIVHELCHFKYMNHSPAFWKYVSLFYPYYKQARKELND